MKMEHYLDHTDYPLWEVIQKGNGPVLVSTDTNGVMKVLPPKTAKETLAGERERKARTTLLLALPEDHLAKFHKMIDAKEMWAAIKSRFGGNEESKKMQNQLEIHGATLSTEDAYQKFLRSLPSAWSQVAFVLRTKPGVDNLNFDDLYNKLRDFESDVKGSTRSSLRTQNVAFVSSENTDSTNDVSTAYVGSTTSGNNSQKEFPSTISLLTNQSSYPQLDHKDLEQLDEFDLEEIDLKWQVAMISMRLKKINNKSGRRIHFDTKEPVGFDKTKVECYNFHKTRHFARECRSKRNQDSKRKDAWNSGYKAKDNGRKPRMRKITLLLWLSTIQLQTLRYDGILSYENEVLQSVFMNKESDLENQPLYDRFVKEGMHVIPPPMTRNYMPSGPDIEIDYSQFTYGPKQSQPSESETQTSDFDTCESNFSVETPELVTEPVVNEPNVVSQPKVWSDAPIIKEYESDSDDDCVSAPSKEQEQPSFAFVSTDKHVKTPRETVKNQFTHSKSPKVDKKGLGYGFTMKACFVCGSFSHLIRDCDFHEKRMAKQAELNKRVCKGTGLRENRPVWNNVQRVNHQNQFVPTAVLTRTGKIPVNTARQNFLKQAVPRKVNTARRNFVPVSPKMNENDATNHVNTVGKQAVVNTAKGNKGNAVKSSACWSWDYKLNEFTYRSENSSGSCSYKTFKFDDPHKTLKTKGIVDSGCSRHMTSNKAYLEDYQDYNGGPVAFGGSQGYITGKVSQMCDKKNKVLFTDTECLVLSSDFKLLDENQVLLRLPRQHNMYSFNLENIAPTGGLTCLIAKVTVDESNMWHRRLGHVNFKNLNKLVKGNLVRGLPFKIFQNDHTCVACQKGKQHKASYETSAILKDFIRQIENQLNKKVKTIRCDNGTKFKNRDMIELCGSKGIKREYSNARTPQQNGVAERKNRTLIEAARTMLADSFLPNTFWAEAVSNACYVLNRVLVTKPQNKTPYELITGKIPIISYIRPFGCHVTILNTLDQLGKFEGKADEDFLVGYSLSSKAFRVYNLETKRVEENLHIRFLENKPNIVGKGPTWLFDLDYLTDSMNYQPVRLENQANKPAGPKETNHSAGTQVNTDAGNSDLEDEPIQEYCVLPSWSSYTSTIKSSGTKNGNDKSREDTGMKSKEKPVNMEEQVFLEELQRLKRQEKEAHDARASGTKTVNTASTPVSTASTPVSTASTPVSTASAFSTGEPSTDYDDSQIPALEDIYENPSEGIFTSSSYDNKGVEADFINLDSTMNVSPIPTSMIHSIHPKT
ncbi:putative ribonuclease H-like domain-containing protein [Tanacetum coccineum]